MPFGKKYVEKFGVDKTVEVSVANIQAAVEAFLRQMKVLKDSDDVFNINLDSIIGKKPTETIRVEIKIKKEV